MSRTRHLNVAVGGVCFLASCVVGQTDPVSSDTAGLLDSQPTALAVEQAPPANAFAIGVATEVGPTGFVWSGRDVTVTAGGLPPNTTVFVGYSTTTNVTTGPCPPALLGECLDIGGAGLTLMGTGQTDGQGNLALVSTLPAISASTIAFQAAFVAGPQGFTSIREDLEVRDPNATDSDGDGAPDGIELQFGSDPLNPDTDGDGLTEGQEVAVHGTNPLNPDTDGDGFSDGEEVAQGTDPTDPTSFPQDLDEDGDGVPASLDCDDLNGEIYPGAPELCDGLANDCNYPAWPALGPPEADTDADGFAACAGDCNDADPGTFPGAPDLPSDGIDQDCDGVDAGDPDQDGDGLSDEDELEIYGTDPGNPDTDVDGLSDGDEVMVYGTDPTNMDTDGDYLADSYEIFASNTDPLNDDTDGGGEEDGSELFYGHDPNDPTDDVDLDADDDGIPDCFDVEECDGVDNDGDGLVDEDFDTDGDGLCDDLEGEIPDCIDNDGDGQIDELTTYTLDLRLTADDRFTAYVDGNVIGSGTSWPDAFDYTVQVQGGDHTIAVFAEDLAQVQAGFIGAVWTNGVLTSATGDGTWLATSDDPGPGWETSMGLGFMAPPLALSDWGTRPASLLQTGAQWVWQADSRREDLYPRNWYLKPVLVCGDPEAPGAEEVCDGQDNDGNGEIDEGFADSDGDGIADCVDVEELCDGVDNDGDGYTDEGFGDADYDGIPDCIDVEDCDGVDNDGDGLVDEDLDGCEEPVEICDQFDNDGDGLVDEGFDADGDGIADCEDDTCVDTDGDGVCNTVDLCEGFPDDVDADADGVPDGCDACPDFDDAQDADGDGIPVACDVCPEDPDTVAAPTGTQTVEIEVNADNAYHLWVDGVAYDLPNAGNWQQTDTLSLTLPAGDHTVAAYVEDWGVYAWFQAVVRIDGQVVASTSDGSFSVFPDSGAIPAGTIPGTWPPGPTDGVTGLGLGLPMGWNLTGYDDSGWGALADCGATATNGDAALSADGGDEAWFGANCRTPFSPWHAMAVRTEITLEPTGVQGTCGDCLGDDTFGDSDGDGICDDLDVCADGDDLADADGDGVADACDACDGFDDGADADGDGVPDGCDVCDDGDDAMDGDGDGVPDACDLCLDGDDAADADGDGVADACDLCAEGDDAQDADGDGLADACDPCPADVFNDADGDGVCGDVDVCPGGDDTADADGDGFPDACDGCPDGADDVDSDGELIPDACDACPEGPDFLDADSDGTPDACDVCPEDPDPATEMVEIEINADNALHLWVDGTYYNLPNDENWTVTDTLSLELPAGEHTVAAYVEDWGINAWFQAVVRVDGEVVASTADGSFNLFPGSGTFAAAPELPLPWPAGPDDGLTGLAIDLPPGWTETDFDDSTWGELTRCTTGETGNAALVADGGDEVWLSANCTTPTEPWAALATRATFTVEPSEICGLCEGDDATGDSDGDGVCDDLDLCPNGSDTLDSDGDGIADGCDACPDDPELATFNWVTWDTPFAGGNTATGTVGNTGITYTSSQPIRFEPNLHTNPFFPPEYGVPNVDPTLTNALITDNTLRFDRPVTDPLLVFASVGQGGIEVPVVFDRDIEVLYQDRITSVSNDGFAGREGQIIVRVPGIHDEVNFSYLANEFRVNFVFGFGSNVDGDVDGDGVPDGCDPCPLDNPDDSDGDGVCDSQDICPDGDDALDEDGDGIPDACDGEACGNGLVEGTEQCDDGGNDDDTDGCRADCTIPVCGDGIVDPMETCETTLPVPVPGEVFDYPDFTDTTGLSVNGDAAVQGNGALRLVRATGNQGGSVFSTTPVQSATFSTSWSFRITNPGGIGDDLGTGNGADGFAFLVQNLSNNVGAVGGGLGYQGISPSIAVEFDTFGNSAFADPNGNHIGVMVNGNVNHTGQPAAMAPSDLESGDRLWAWVDFDGTVMSVFLSDTAVKPVMPVTTRDVSVEMAAVLGNGSAFVGFTAATGSAYENIDLFDWAFEGDDQICRDDCTYCGDGVVNGEEDCDDANTDDTDGCSNSCELNCEDVDGDFVCDDVDVCLDGDDALDEDGDGVPDASDPCPLDALDDADGDGVCDSDDVCPDGDDAADADGDGVADACDACPEDDPDDTDGDGVCDSDDVCPVGDDTVDTDGDGAPDACDTCALGDDFVDTDGDGIPDACDDDCDDLPPTPEVCTEGQVLWNDLSGFTNLGVGEPLDVPIPGWPNAVTFTYDGGPIRNFTPPSTRDGSFVTFQGVEVTWTGTFPYVDLLSNNGAPVDGTVSYDFGGVATELGPDWRFVVGIAGTAGGPAGPTVVTSDADLTLIGSFDAFGGDNYATWLPPRTYRGSQGGPADGYLFFSLPADASSLQLLVDDQGTLPDQHGYVVGLIELPACTGGEVPPPLCDPGLDDDCDNVCNDQDVCPDGDDADDADGDTVPDACDVCPDGDDTIDLDGNGTPDACECSDEDGDGVCDDEDPCPIDNPDDTDGDGVCDSDDVCPDGDDTADADGDGVPDACDVCAEGDDTADEDGDGVPDACDACPTDNPDDTDGDTVCDSDNLCPGGDDLVDVDGDGVPDACDEEVCGNGLIEGFEACDDGGNDDDSDGCRADCTIPVCGDGIVDPMETCETTLPVPSSGETFAFADFTDTTGLSVNGDASVLGNGALRLVASQVNQAGSVFSTTPVESASFSTAWSFVITNPGGSFDELGSGNGADGFAFVVQNIASNVGGVGGGIGYEGISPSVAVEFDTFGNVAAGDPSGNHIAVMVNGDVGHGSQPAAQAPFTLESGSTLFAWVDYDGTVMSVFLSDTSVKPATPVTTRDVSAEMAAVLGNGSAFVGFTAATGLAYENIDILDWSFSGDDAVCRDDCTYCGDGIVNGEEACDDGNSDDDDACSNTCEVACSDMDADGVCDVDDLCPGGDDTVDTDGDGEPDFCDVCPDGPNDQDADGDGIADACDACPNDPDLATFNWVTWDVPHDGGDDATGTVGNTSIVYTSSEPVQFEAFLHTNPFFPPEYGVPNVDPSLINLLATDNTLTFARPVTDPLFVFASVGSPTISVPVQFDRPIEVLYEDRILSVTDTGFTGQEGQIIVRVPGIHTEVNFSYLTAENRVNFVFGFSSDTTTDTDGDGVPDGCDACPLDNPDDPDGNGICGLQEPIDSDGDGMSDADELNVYGTDPTTADTDGDGLSDGDEVEVFFTDPLNPDTDGGGVDDGTEVSVDGTDPFDPEDDLVILGVDDLAPGDLILTEVMQNPAASSDTDGEWFEVYNASPFAVDLFGMIVSDLGSDLFIVDRRLVVEAGAYAVLADNDDPSTNGEVAADYGWGGGMTLGNGDGEIVLSNISGTIDEIRWDGGGTWPDPDGATMSLDPGALDAVLNDDGVNWCEGTTPFGAGDLGTPGAANPVCPVTSALSYAVDIAPIFETQCTFCHNSGFASGGFDMSFYDAMFGTSSVGLPYVQPGSPGESYLWLKMEGTHADAGGGGTIMPPGGALDSGTLDTVFAWIADGALP